MTSAQLLPDPTVVETLRRMTRRRLAAYEMVAVKTWCRKCGLPVLLNVVRDYNLVVRHFYELDDQPMSHKNLHRENGGWGIHWRLDEVLATLFPREHAEDCWPKPAWYEGDESEGFNILVLDKIDLEEGVEGHVMDVELRMLVEAINRDPRSREDLEEYFGEVWDTYELSERFSVTGFRAPFAVVKEKATGVRGSVLFQNAPRYFFAFAPDRVL